MPRKVVLLFVLSFVLFFCSSAVPQPQELTNLSSSITDKLQYLKQEISYTNQQLEIVLAKLQLSEKEQEILKQQLTKSSESLIAINEQLNDCYNTITIQKQKLKVRLTISLILLIILIIRTIGMIVGFILYAKGIKLPRWLDILL